MTNNKFKPVRFISNNDLDFGKELRKRVNAYFKENKIEKTGDYRIWIKIIIMPMLYLAPFGLILSGLFLENLIVFFGLWLLMAIGMAGCGLGIMHDANHGAISKNQKVNNFIGYVINLAGGYALNWKIQHNVLHHSYTNIDGYDEDIAPSGVMRFSPHQPAKPFFRFQHIYAWFLYGLMTLSWTLWKDFLSLSRYNKKGLIEAQGRVYINELAKLIIHKLIYFAIFLVMPILMLDIEWYLIVLGWFCMHFVTGLILACIFQPAHVVPSSEFPLPNDENKIIGDKTIHQLQTTANFAPKNRLFSWYVGGLNYQIEHHLFPNMCHIHHRKISKIVEETAKEFNVPYHSEPTFIGALYKHAKMLYKFRK
ncbi:MAG: acyl-CoA desaturase [Crocinitomicaceae bacterium]|nr:acyl-CoA desaturase [Crocinitomicaceae bacterium]